MENQRGHFYHLQDEEEEEAALPVSLETFETKVSNSLTLLLSNEKPESEILSFSWIQQCFRLIPIINKAFTNLILDIDHPMSNWEAASVEKYLSNSLYLLDHFNLISSSISHLGQARLLLFHALSLLEKSPSSALEHLKPIEPLEVSMKDYKEQDGDRAISGSEKERLVHHAIMDTKSIGFWVCGVILSALRGGAKPYMEMKKAASGFSGSSEIDSVLSIFDAIVERGIVIKEVKELNDAVACLQAAIANGEQSDEVAEELQRKLEDFEKEMDEFGKEVDEVFSKVLDERNQLIDTIRIS